MRSDTLVIMCGNVIANTPKEDGDQFLTISRRLRLMANLLMNVQKIDTEVDDMSSLIQGRKFDTIVKAVEIMIGLDTETPTPSVAKHIKGN